MTYHFITPEELAPVLQRLEALEEKAQVYDVLIEEWVSHKAALKITGINSKTLKNEREREGTLIVHKMAGSKGTDPRYLVSSLIAYNKSKKKPTTRQMYLEAKQAKAA